jgi:intracellular septation protein A
MFIDSHFNKKYMILGFTKKFYKKELKEEEIEFLKSGDGYWVIVMFFNTVIHLYIVNFLSNEIWAFYSSIGWYILFFISLIIQIIYGKTHAVKMYSR